MYWYKRSFLLIFIIASGLQACKPDVVNTNAQYFDIKGYFTREISRLSKKHPTVSKTVVHNAQHQQKTLAINNWESELALFTASDINKPAWRNDYAVTQTPTQVTYKAKTPGLKVRQVIIKKSGQKITAISIRSSTKNILYNSTENLSYYPDSVYSIEKTQHVRFIGTNEYKIKGKF